MNSKVSVVTMDMEARADKSNIGQMLDDRAERLGMEDVWMATARMLAMRSKCKRHKVGCVVTDWKMRRVLGNGYNGRAAGVDEECPGTDPCCLHAEVNALIACGSLERNKVMFVTTMPCEKCAMMIINSGFKRVVYSEKHPKTEGVELLERAGLLVARYRRRAERAGRTRPVDLSEEELPE